ncbi:hypothetical protein H4219_004968 [Mycoemilia scoparia]|uniref:SGF29 C-terminal domain-containing protein n=1 Tax=Mycoemilia scoparia TaxID=417184 RepID=A0A9W7ZQT1_9FUNG|nr:hypothetical protein H4219_004968 [Mycoemilia scoparia]
MTTELWTEICKLFNDIDENRHKQFDLVTKINSNTSTLSDLKYNTNNGNEKSQSTPMSMTSSSTSSGNGGSVTQLPPDAEKKLQNHKLLLKQSMDLARAEHDMERRAAKLLSKLSKLMEESQNGNGRGDNKSLGDIDSVSGGLPSSNKPTPPPLPHHHHHNGPHLSAMASRPRSPLARGVSIASANATTTATAGEGSDGSGSGGSSSSNTDLLDKRGTSSAGHGSGSGSSHSQHYVMPLTNERRSSAKPTSNANNNNNNTSTRRRRSNSAVSSASNRSGSVPLPPPPLQGHSNSGKTTTPATAGGDSKSKDNLQNSLVGTYVAAHIPGAADQLDEWILAKIRQVLSSTRVEVEDVDDGGRYTLSTKQILKINPHRPEIKRGDRALGMYPGTTVFYKATVLAPPSQNPNPLVDASWIIPGIPINGAYKVRFDDDDYREMNIPTHLVFPMPRGRNKH